MLSTVLDDELANNQQRALDIVSANDTFGAFSATLLASGWAEVANAGIPLYVWAINLNGMNGHETIFGNSGVICVTTSRSSRSTPPPLSDATNVASLGYGVTQNSKDCVKAQATAVERYGADTGQKVTHKNDDLEFGLPNGIGPEVTATKQASVDFIMPASTSTA